MARYTENFNVPDGSDLGWLYEHDPDNAPGWGWTVPGHMYSTYLIQGGEVVALVADPFGKVAAHLNPNHQASIDHTGTRSGVWVRAPHNFPALPEFTNGYGLWFDTSSGIDLRIHLMGNSGALTTLASATSLAGGVVAPYRLTIRAIDDSISAVVNGVTQLSVQDSTYTSGTRTGIYAGGCDNFEATDELGTPGIDPDAGAWINAVQLADGMPLQAQVKRAVTNFVLKVKIYGSYLNFHQVGLLAGPRTLAGCAVPLWGPTPELVRWEQQHHDQFTGLQDPSNPTFANGRYIKTNVTDNSLPQTSRHMAVWSADNQRLHDNNVALFGHNSNPQTHVGRFAATGGVMFYRDIGTGYPSDDPPHAEGLYGTARFNANNFARIHPSLQWQQSFTQSAGNPSSAEILLYTRDLQHYWRGRLAFWSIGESTSLTALRGDVQQYLTDLVTPVGRPGAAKFDSIYRTQRRIW